MFVHNFTLVFVCSPPGTWRDQGPGGSCWCRAVGVGSRGKTEIVQHDLISHLLTAKLLFTLSLLF